MTENDTLKNVSILKVHIVQFIFFLIKIIMPPSAIIMNQDWF